VHPILPLYFSSLSDIQLSSFFIITTSLINKNYHPIDHCNTAIMIVHPDMMKTSSLLSATSSVAPIPTVVPNKPIYVTAGDVGNRTLW
jgi:hypothetical protein